MDANRRRVRQDAAGTMHALHDHRMARMPNTTLNVEALIAHELIFS